MFIPLDAFAGFLLRPVFRALEEWAGRIRQSKPLEPSTGRLIRERAANETSRWANSHAISFGITVAPLTGAVATFGAVMTTELPIFAQVVVGALGGLLGLFLSVAFIALVFLAKAIPTVREERRETQEARSRQLNELGARLARPHAANAAIEDHEMALSNLFSRAENAGKYQKPHGLAEPINTEFDAIRKTLEDYNLKLDDGNALETKASDEMEWDELRDIVAAGQKELAGISLSLRRVLPMLSD